MVKNDGKKFNGKTPADFITPSTMGCGNLDLRLLKNMRFKERRLLLEACGKYSVLIDFENKLAFCFKHKELLAVINAPDISRHVVINEKRNLVMLIGRNFIYELWLDTFEYNIKDMYPTGWLGK